MRILPSKVSPVTFSSLVIEATRFDALSEGSSVLKMRTACPPRFLFGWARRRAEPMSFRHRFLGYVITLHDNWTAIRVARPLCIGLYINLVWPRLLLSNCLNTSK